MIVPLTASTSVDRTVTLADRLERGSVHRAESVISRAGGMGINISRAHGRHRGSAACHGPADRRGQHCRRGTRACSGHLFAHPRSEPPAQRLALPVAYGSAAAGLPGTTIPEPDHVARGRVSVSMLQQEFGVVT